MNLGVLEDGGVVYPARERARLLREIGGAFCYGLVGDVSGHVDDTRTAGWLAVQESAVGSSSIATTLSSSPRRRSTSARPIPRPPPVTT
jgi:hypothetical protein